MVAQFGGPAWTLDEATGQYWYHSFLPEQPDLDWRNPAVRAAMLDDLRFWFDRGIDGFRIDVLWMIAKDDWPWRDGPVADAPAGLRRRPPERARARRRARRWTRGCASCATSRTSSGPRADRRGLHGAAPARALLRRRRARRAPPVQLRPRHAALGGRRRSARRSRRTRRALPDDAWPNWVLGNHDQSRVATRIGAAQARVAAMLLLTLRGTPTIYYGDELGLPDVDVPPGRVVDVAGRDPERSPMPWTTRAPRRLHRRRPVAADDRRRRAWQRRGTARRAVLDAHAPSPAARAPAAERRAPAGRGRPSTHPRASSRTTGSTATTRFRVLLNLTPRPGRRAPGRARWDGSALLTHARPGSRAVRCAGPCRRSAGTRG